MQLLLRPVGQALSFLFIVALSCSFAFAQPQGVVPTAVNIYAVNTSGQLVRFNSRTPGSVTTVGMISGLQPGETIVGLDFRPATGELVVLGSASRLYSVNKATAAATFLSTLSVPLNGSAFGVDFNPTVDRLRIVSDTGQNLRVNVTTGAAIVDGAINGAATGVDAAAYTNSFNGASTTMLYDVSAATDSLYLQSPPNAGTLVLVGPLGVDVTATNGFDVVTIDNSALAAFTVGGSTNLFSINLNTGQASSVGPIGAGTSSFVGFAAETAMTANYLVYGLSTSNGIVTFNSSRPNTILGSFAVTGLQTGEMLLGIDFRPATGRLFGLGSSNRIYAIDIFTGAATSVGTLTTPLLGTNFGFDFNPVPDRIRITSDLEQNLRANPADGSNVVDGTLAYAIGDVNFGANPNIVASGYTNSFGGTTTTTLYNVDSALDILVTQNPPNAGTLNTIGSLGVETTGEAGLDIHPGNNTALAVFQSSGASASGLYQVNLSSGAAAIIGPIGGGAVIRDIAIARSTAANAATIGVDFDGDGRTDSAVFRVDNNTWFVRRSSDASFFGAQFGLAQSDILTPGDYDGDGRTDLSVWRIPDGLFYVFRSSDSTVSAFKWGIPDDQPLARDYDGDGKTDYAIVRRSGGQLVWYIQNTSNGSVRIETFGLDSDFPAPADHDGDGRTDLVTYRGSIGDQATFFVQKSTGGSLQIDWGLGGDLVVPGDYDGDGKADFAVLRPGSPFVWYVLKSTDLSLSATTFGTKPQFSTQGDYDGDGKTDVATFDPITGRFYALRSSDGGTTEIGFGQNGDYPVANFATH